MTRIIDLNRERWLSLANTALHTVANTTAARREALKVAAGRMVSATPPASEPHAMSLCLAFRWSCTAYATAPGSRFAEGEAVRHQAAAIRALFDHTPPPPDAVSQSVPAPPPAQTSLDLPEHPWMSRADVAG
ncbi:MAG: hypothetical protein KJ728_11815 [Alphaproteobacteria bacterium]|uniref:Uncharacterized protein n=1 Tax=viral metagenome TaxID=1070528 RepID=A0A6M3XBP8_9ZZZZ|nr:hypothetical protein [Alphaproteobacteria bacterium]